MHSSPKLVVRVDKRKEFEVMEDAYMGKEVRNEGE